MLDVDTEEWVVHRHKERHDYLTACRRLEWNAYLRVMGVKGYVPPYELVAEGLTKAVAQQMVKLVKES